MRRVVIVAAALAGLAGCQTPRPAAPSVVVETTPQVATWRTILTPVDLDRLQRADQAWTRALADARRAGFNRRITSEGDLFDAQAALPRATLPPGSYRCRAFRFGGGSGRSSAFGSQGPFFCYVGVEGAILSFTQQTGTRRPGGYVYDDTDIRQVFIGAVATGQQVPPAYGATPQRDVAGHVERVGPFRYRLVMPWTAAGATLEILELVPAPR